MLLLSNGICRITLLKPQSLFYKRLSNSQQLYSYCINLKLRKVNSPLYKFSFYNFIHKCIRSSSTSSKRPGKSSAVLIVPLAALVFSVWAFLLDGISLKSSQPDDAKPAIADENEEVYVSKVETLYRKKQARQKAISEE